MRKKMNKLVFLALILVLTPIAVFGGNTKSYRVSFTIPQSIELSKEDSMTEETIRNGESVILKTVVAK